jgi:hypothetical protein
MGNRSVKPGTFGTIALIIVLFVMLGATAWYAARTWIAVSGPPMPATGYVAMALGVVFSLLVGVGLMSLLFYSSRHGYDEPSHLSGREDDDD